jgi:hypothetical protein
MRTYRQLFRLLNNRRSYCTYELNLSIDKKIVGAIII